MSLLIELAPDVESRLELEAADNGVQPSAYASRLIENGLRKGDPEKARALLRKWDEEGDEEEQRETFEALKKGLNAHQSSGRIIYP